MNRRVLFVDDEPNVLEGIKRLTRKQFEVSTSVSPVEALRLLSSEPDFAVIVSDMRMPEMSGVEFLAAAKQCRPDAVRIMLTGNQDQKTAIEAVNCGEVFKFLNKPCEVETLTTVLEHALLQHQLLTSERDLLTRTLQGSINVLIEALSIAKPEAFGRNDRVHKKATELVAGMAGVEPWEIQAAARLSQLGCIAMPKAVLEKVVSGRELSPTERADYDHHPELGAQLLASIPRMEGVAQCILYQHKNFDGSGFPADSRRGKEIPLGARILRLVLAYDDLQCRGSSDAAAVQDIRARTGRFDPELVVRLEQSLPQSVAKTYRLVPDQLTTGLMIAEDVQNDQGILLICRGQIVTAAIQRHLRQFHALGTLSSPILVTSTEEPG